MINDISIVTAFFDIGRGNIDENYPTYLKRTTETYFEYFSNLSELENEMIVFTSKEFKNKILEIRVGKPTKIILVDLKKKFKSQLKVIKKIQESEEFKNKIKKEMILNIEYWSPEYVLVNNLKGYFVNQAIKNKLVSNDLVAWIDFGYVREKSTLNNVKIWRYNFDKNKIHFFKIRKHYILNKIEDVHRAIFNNEVYIIGGSIVGSRDKWNEFYKILRKNQNELLMQNIVDDDQGLYMMTIFKKPKLFKLNYLGKDNWFYLFKRYDETSKVNIIEKIKDILK